jgi:hypothetical protein
MPSTLESPSREARFATMLGRLSKLSVDKRFEAFADVPWDEPYMAIDPTDSRWELWSLDPLGRSDWYLTQPDEVRARIGLHRLSQMLHTGWQFENILQVGLLIHAMRQSSDSLEFRYLHHEIAEESQHSMMFHEFVRRSGLQTTGMPRGTNLVVRPFLMAMARWDPKVLALAALAGEEPADYLQREQLKIGYPHPLMERITRIHVTEEARHISFARHYLRRTVPELGRARRALLSLAMPVVMWAGALLMVRPGRSFRRANSIPAAVQREANRTPEARTLLAGSVQKVRDFADELGLANPLARRLWFLLFGPPVGPGPGAGAGAGAGVSDED